jgi:hypothetical protein
MLHTKLFALGLFQGPNYDDRELVKPWLVAMNEAPNSAGWVARAKECPRDIELLVYHEVMPALKDGRSRFAAQAYTQLREIATKAIERQANQHRLDVDALEDHFQRRLHGFVELDQLLATPQNPWPLWHPNLNRLKQSGFKLMSRIPCKWSPSVPLIPFVRAQALWARKDFVNTRDEPPEPREPSSTQPVGEDPRDTPKLRYYRRGLEQFRCEIESLSEQGPRPGRPIGVTGRTAAASRIQAAIRQLHKLSANSKPKASELRDVTVRLTAKHVITVPIQHTWKEITKFEEKSAWQDCLKEYVDGWAESLSILHGTVSPNGGED